MMQENDKKYFPTLDDLQVTNKRVLVRLDLNVPMRAGSVTDATRIMRLLPTLKELVKKKAKIIVLAHLGRPGGKYEPDLTLAPLVDALETALKNVPVHFGVDCVGPEATAAVKALQSGEILLLENLRFHAGEEKNDPSFAKALAAHGEIYINDAFSCSHRAHASVVGITQYLPFAAGRLMEEELVNLERLLTHAKRPFAALIGGAKVSTKLALLESLSGKVDSIIIGGAMANTFLAAKGYNVGKSLIEPELKSTAKNIMATAQKKGCTIYLPEDVMHAPPDKTGQNSFSTVDNIPPDEAVFDVGNATFVHRLQCLKEAKTVLWNGPMGIFDRDPGAISTFMFAREIAALTRQGKLISIAGGGDTVAAINTAGLMGQFTYVSTAGGAFLEWLEGKTLPGVAVLQSVEPDAKQAHERKIL